MSVGSILKELKRERDAIGHALTILQPMSKSTIPAGKVDKVIVKKIVAKVIPINRSRRAAHRTQAFRAKMSRIMKEAHRKRRRLLQRSTSGN